jgi:hypothetical protein
MHDSFRTMNNIDHLMNDKIEPYNKLISFIKKYNPSMTGILLDTNDSRSIEVRTSSSFISTTETIEETESFQLMFSYPQGSLEIEKYIMNVVQLITPELDTKVRYYFDNVKLNFIEKKM